MGNRRIRITIFVSFCFLWSLWEIISLSGCSDIPLSSILESGKVKLSWNDVPGAMSYNVYMSTSPGITKYNSNKIRNATSPITITDLEPGTIYYFVVTVIDESGESEESKEISYTAVMDTVGSIDFEDLLNKSMPEDTASKSEKGQVTLAWDNVPNAISYNIYWNNSPGVTKHNGKKISNVKNPHTINGLKRGATYYFVVTAVGESGESEESEEISFTVGQ
jgi:trans-2-enoyl-CoA reductase